MNSQNKKIYCEDTMKTLVTGLTEIEASSDPKYICKKYTNLTTIESTQLDISSIKFFMTANIIRAISIDKSMFGVVDKPLLRSDNVSNEAIRYLDLKTQTILIVDPLLYEDKFNVNIIVAEHFGDIHKYEFTKVINWA